MFTTRVEEEETISVTTIAMIYDSICDDLSVDFSADNCISLTGIQCFLAAR